MPNVMAAQPNIGGALCESSVIPFLVPCQKVWLTSAARLPCSYTANTGERKTWTQSEFCSWQNSVRGQEPLKYIIITSGYATWFTAGAAIRIAHYDAIGDVITRKL